jgi:hypothetical protein
VTSITHAAAHPQTEADIPPPPECGALVGRMEKAQPDAPHPMLYGPFIN